MNYKRNILIQKLLDLQAKNIIKRMGFYENVVVLLKYVQQWCITVPEGFIVPEPWLNFESKMRPEIFFKWAGVIMNKIFECPGSSLTYLSEAFEYLSVRAVQDICELLQKCECVQLHSLLYRKPDLFSDNDDTSAELDEYNEFDSPGNILVIPAKDCLSKYSCIRSAFFFANSPSCVKEDSQ